MYEPRGSQTPLFIIFSNFITQIHDLTFDSKKTNYVLAFANSFYITGG